METIQKLSYLADDMGFELDETPPAPGGNLSPHAGSLTLAGTPACPQFSQEDTPFQNGLPIHMAALPGGKRAPLLKTMLTSACERNCYYCPFRAGRDSRRVTFKPDELAKAVTQLSEARVIKGAFLSSGIAGGGVRTQDRLLDTAAILREKLKYRGYLHLKLMPGAEEAQIERAMQLADRVSVNLEAPNPERLKFLAPQKEMLAELLPPLQIVEKIRKSKPGYLGWNGHWPSTTTQFVVGAVGESDLELLKTVSFLYRELRLACSYFSSFHPIRNTPFENQEAANPWREHRLYQASFLLRDYGFELEEMPFVSEGYLPLETDPKQAWAFENLSGSPVEINRADRSQLLRVPGIGIQGVQKILQARLRGNRLRSLEDLKSLGVFTGRAAPFILLDGRRPASQLSLL